MGRSRYPKTHVVTTPEGLSVLVQEALPPLGKGESKVLKALLEDTASGSWVTKYTLKFAHKISPNTINRHISNLLAAKYLEVKETKRGNRYRLTPLGTKFAVNRLTQGPQDQKPQEIPEETKEMATKNDRQLLLDTAKACISRLDHWDLLDLMEYLLHATYNRPAIREAADNDSLQPTVPSTIQDVIARWSSRFSNLTKNYRPYQNWADSKMTTPADTILFIEGKEVPVQLKIKLPT